MAGTGDPGLRALVRILTYPAHAMNCCPKCDVDRLNTFSPCDREAHLCKI